MRYIKRFNESVDNSVKQTISDILLPISDMGYDVSVKEYTTSFEQVNTELIIRIVIWSDPPLVMSDEVKDEFLTMKDYLESEGYNSIVAKFFSSQQADFSRKEIDEFLNIKYPIQNLLFIAKKI